MKKLRVLLTLIKAKLSALITAEFPSRMEVSLEGLKAPVVVCRDSWGVPHIYAENEEDLFHVFGYVQAQDRLFLMDLQRRAAWGKLSEVLGEKPYETDLFFRTVGLGRAAKDTFEALRTQGDRKILSISEKFDEGVNKAIEDMKNAGKLPIEFKILSYEPDPWTPIDTLTIGKLIGWSLTGNFFDLEFMKLHEGFGNQADELFPFENPYETCIFPSSFIPADPPDDLTTQTKPENSRARSTHNINDSKVVKAIGAILEWKEKAEGWILPFNVVLASNNWVVNGSLTTSGKPILCNDPHLQLTAPPVWYEAHLVVRGSSGISLNVRGVTFPGMPFIVIGHNQYLAWGCTNVGADVIDFYRYVWNDDGSQYWYVDRWEDLTKVQEVIRVKVGDSIEERIVNIDMTRNGPIMERYDERFAMRWVGHYPTFEARALYKFNIARNMEEFKEGLRDFLMPAQNVVYADVSGNIAWWANGRYPIRSNVSDANNYLEYRLPFNGSKGRGEWGDWDDADAWIDPPEEVPHVINPKEGYVATANNCPISREDFPHWLGWIWSENYRAQRIINLLNQLQPLGLEDMENIQTDVYHIAADKLVPYIANACKNRHLSEELEQALKILKDWDFKMDKDQVAPTIFATWLERFRKNTFNDEYEKAKFEGRYPPTETIQYLVEQNSTQWFDNVGTEEVETCEDIIFQSFVDAVNYLKEDLGPNMLEWKWGAIHRLDMEHPLGSAIAWFNYPELPAGGWENCVSPADGLKVKGGPSWRQIIDLSNLSNSLCILPGGQRGHPFSKHYHDQLELWLEGKYKPMTFPTSPEEQEDIESTTYFRPKI